jgi:hypothetical protein
MKKKSSLIEEFRKIGKTTTALESYEQLIYFDGRQYSLKIPKKVMDKIDYKKGDMISFEWEKPFTSFKDIRITYKRKDGKTE